MIRITNLYIILLFYNWLSKLVYILLYFLILCRCKGTFFFDVVTWTFDKTEVAVIIDAQELHINTCGLEIKQNHTLFLRQRKKKQKRVVKPLWSCDNKKKVANYWKWRRGIKILKAYVIKAPKNRNKERWLAVITIIDDT